MIFTAFSSGDPLWFYDLEWWYIQGKKFAWQTAGNPSRRKIISECLGEMLPTLF